MDEKLNWQIASGNHNSLITAHRGKVVFTLRFIPATMSRGAYWKLMVSDSGELMKTKQPEYSDPWQAMAEAEEYQEWKRSL